MPKLIKTGEAYWIYGKYSIFKMNSSRFRVTDTTDEDDDTNL